MHHSPTPPVPAADPPCCPWCALADLLALLMAHGPSLHGMPQVPEEGEP